MWDFVLRLVISLNFSCMTENRSYPERRSDDFSPIRVHQEPHQSQQRQMPEQRCSWSQSVLRGYKRGNGHKVEEEKFQLDIRKKCVFHERDATMEPNESVGPVLGDEYSGPE